MKSEIEREGDCLKINGNKIRIYNEKQADKIQWKEVNADYVCESSGVFLTKESAGLHLNGGAKRVIISAPAKDDS